MIVTVTPNTALDHTLFIPALTPNTTIRATSSMISVAGKATDTAWVLCELGIPALALGFAAGKLGHQMDAMLRQKGVPTDFVWVSGETRLNTVIVCADGNAQTTITVDTLEVSPQQVKELYQKYQSTLRTASCVTISGSLPHGLPSSLYADLIGQANQCHVPVVLDASGACLRSGFASLPTVIKPNREELEQLYGQSCPTEESLLQAAQDLHARSGTSIVITLGADGALAVLPGRVYRIPALKVRIASPAGAGDAVVAGLAAGLARGDTLEDSLCLAFAAAGASVMMPGTADIRKADVDALLPQVVLIPVD